MLFILHRKYLKESYTIGALYVDGIYFCDTLEDKVREEKIKNETAIPYGTYKVVLTESPKFKRELPLLLDVPRFTGIRIHRGNTDSDTSGCILVGENKQKGKVINSAMYELLLVNMIKGAIFNGDSVHIEIKEHYERTTV